MPILTAEERVGTVLGGRYRLDSILGSGGTSTVYRAAHSFTNRAVALKLLKPEHSRDRGLVARFLKEARVASTLVHPHVVAILDMGTEDGDTYLAMELLEGRSLAAMLGKEGPLAPGPAIALLRPVMEAIRAAHDKGIVHRDLKPENVLVGDRGDGIERAIVLDFGMAKTNDAAWGHATQSGVIVGTPFYMSPEQAEGANDVGPASDVWSMGVLLYRAFSGEQPFSGNSATALLLAIARGDHVPLDVRAPALPAPLASWVEGALVVDRAARYPDMGAMLAALDRALAGEMNLAASASAEDLAPSSVTSSGIVMRQETLTQSALPAARRSRGPVVVAALALTAFALIALASRLTASEPRGASVDATPVAEITVTPPGPSPSLSAIVTPPSAPVVVVPEDVPAIPAVAIDRAARATSRRRTTPEIATPTPAGRRTGLLEEW